jgi:hypothetical protein
VTSPKVREAASRTPRVSRAPFVAGDPVQATRGAPSSGSDPFWFDAVVTAVQVLGVLRYKTSPSLVDKALSLSL